MISAEALRLASLHTQTELALLCRLADDAAAALAAAETRAAKAEAALKRAKQRQAELKTAPADLVAAARAYLDKVCDITTEEFQCGGEKAEREALRTVLEAIEDDTTR